jgi:hypothetical protein
LPTVAITRRSHQRELIASKGVAPGKRRGRQIDIGYTLQLSHREPLDLYQSLESNMSLSHAVVSINHLSAQVLQFDAENTESHKIQAHAHDTRQHNSGVRTEHEFFGEVCDRLAGIREVVVTGSSTALSDFRHYVEKHRPAVALQIVGWESADHPTDGQLVAFARKYFMKRETMVGIPSA